MHRSYIFLALAHQYMGQDPLHMEASPWAQGIVKDISKSAMPFKLLDKKFHSAKDVSPHV